MPSPSDSSRSLTSRPSTRGLTHLGLQRPWLQALLTLGLAQVLLGILVVTFSMVASSVTITESIKRSCPSWAGFSVSWVHCDWGGRLPGPHPSTRGCKSTSLASPHPLGPLTPCRDCGVHPVARGSLRCFRRQAEPPVPTLSPAGVLRGSWHRVLEAAIYSSGRCQGPSARWEAGAGHLEGCLFMPSGKWLSS